MTDQPVPDQPDGIESDSFDLPRAENAADRVRAFLEWFGDGVVEIGSPTPTQSATPLYARDLQALLNAWERSDSFTADELRAVVDPLIEQRDRLLSQVTEARDAARAFESQLDMERATRAREAKTELGLMTELADERDRLRHELAVAEREIERRRREMEFESNGRETICGAGSRDNLKYPLCACATPEQLAALDPKLSPPQCGVHTEPEGGA